MLNPDTFARALTRLMTLSVLMYRNCGREIPPADSTESCCDCTLMCWLTTLLSWEIRERALLAAVLTTDAAWEAALATLRALEAAVDTTETAFEMTDR
jgi:hypothetical protein